MGNPYITAKEPHYTIDESARRLRMSTGALVERIDAGKVETKFNGRTNFIAAREIGRVSEELRGEYQAAQEAESERAAQEHRETDGAFIAREMAHLQELAERYGFVPDGKD